MFKAQNHFIYVAINHKYQNHLIPILPSLLISYLLEQPEKISLYLNPSLKLNLLLESLAITYRKYPSLNILKEIISCVEVGNE